MWLERRTSEYELGMRSRLSRFSLCDRARKMGRLSRVRLAGVSSSVTARATHLPSATRQSLQQPFYFWIRVLPRTHHVVPVYLRTVCHPRGAERIRHAQVQLA